MNAPVMVEIQGETDPLEVRPLLQGHPVLILYIYVLVVKTLTVTVMSSHAAAAFAECVWL